MEMNSNSGLNQNEENKKLKNLLQRKNNQIKVILLVFILLVSIALCYQQSHEGLELKHMAERNDQLVKELKGRENRDNQYSEEIVVLKNEIKQLKISSRFNHNQYSETMASKMDELTEKLRESNKKYEKLLNESIILKEENNRLKSNLNFKEVINDLNKESEQKEEEYIQSLNDKQEIKMIAERNDQLMKVIKDIEIRDKMFINKINELNFDLTLNNNLKLETMSSKMSKLSEKLEESLNQTNFLKGENFQLKSDLISNELKINRLSEDLRLKDEVMDDLIQELDLIEEEYNKLEDSISPPECPQTYKFNILLHLWSVIISLSVIFISNSSPIRRFDELYQILVILAAIYPFLLLSNYLLK